MPSSTAEVPTLESGMSDIQKGVEVVKIYLTAAYSDLLEDRRIGGDHNTHVNLQARIDATPSAQLLHELKDLSMMCDIATTIRDSVHVALASKMAKEGPNAVLNLIRDIRAREKQS